MVKPISQPVDQPRATADRFRSLMAGFPTGVCVVTTMGAQGRPWGMTCSSLCSVSLDPPTLLVCLRDGSPTLDALVRRETFTVNLLHHSARRTAELFASGAQDRFARVRWSEPADSGGPHLPDDSHVIADCRVSRAELINDHVVVFGEVLRVAVVSMRRPLLYGLRRYAEWPDD
ncbi:hypothetical protein GCM10022224_040200 [Nonomuraea antimicrobica]|uniref:Flavin reductase like domain-containing protein n=1 Tax=Nonomuraea antimicrobica TaxID=561173 RepID=A0ABP7BWN5_9ACTN